MSETFNSKMALEFKKLPTSRGPQFPIYNACRARIATRIKDPGDNKIFCTDTSSLRYRSDRYYHVQSLDSQFLTTKNACLGSQQDLGGSESLRNIKAFSIFFLKFFEIYEPSIFGRIHQDLKRF